MQYFQKSKLVQVIYDEKHIKFFFKKKNKIYSCAC